MPASFTGSAADGTNGAGLAANSTTVTLQRSSDSLYWTGSAWSASVTSLATTHGATSGATGATWTSAATMPDWSAQSDGTYVVTAKVTVEKVPGEQNIDNNIGVYQIQFRLKPA